MGKFDQYKISLKGLSSGLQDYSFVLDSKFFADIDGEELQRGDIKVTVAVKKITGAFEMKFQMAGEVKVPCDRCLDDVDIPVSYDGKLYVKFGKSYSEENDDVIIIPEEDDSINIAWFLYEFAVLSLPMKRMHPPGKCNKAVSAKLKRHSPPNKDNDESDEIELLDDLGFGDEDTKTGDSRWDKLRDIDIE
ncbi:MAG: DUF177 domain-containing protein [Bacteroidales bacterium]|jgi:uncharacterized metal-binding protein YceD (DUF177 family)|nr:DUF177 domain-containing protein [Bacteroidales bacterium]